MDPKNKSNTEFQIIPLPNGPYYYFTDFEPKVVDGIINSRGEELRNLKGAALCRCGASDNKPFCVGAHGKIGFSDRKETDRHLDKRVNYVGKEITIHDNRGICSHVGFCTDSLPSVFKQGKEPWIDSNGAPTEEIIATIEKCPSGALSYSLEGIEHRDQDTALDRVIQPLPDQRDDVHQVVHPLHGKTAGFHRNNHFIAHADRVDR